MKESAPEIEGKCGEPAYKTRYAKGIETVTEPRGDQQRHYTQQCRNDQNSQAHIIVDDEGKGAQVVNKSERRAGNFAGSKDNPPKKVFVPPQFLPHPKSWLARPRSKTLECDYFVLLMWYPRPLYCV